MKKGLSVLLIAAALFGFYGGATSLTDVLASKDYWEEQGEKSTADMNKLEDGLNQLKDNEKAYLDGQKTLADGEKALADGEAQYAQGLADYAAAPAKLADGERKLAAGKAELAAGYASYAAAPAKLAEGEKKLAAGKAELAAGYASYAAAPAQLADARNKIAAGEEKLAEGADNLKKLGNAVSGINQILTGYSGTWKPGYDALHENRQNLVKGLDVSVGEATVKQVLLGSVAPKLGPARAAFEDAVGGINDDNQYADGYKDFANDGRTVASGVDGLISQVKQLVGAASAAKGATAASLKASAELRTAAVTVLVASGKFDQSTAQGVVANAIGTDEAASAAAVQTINSVAAAVESDANNNLTSLSALKKAYTDNLVAYADAVDENVDALTSGQDEIAGGIRTIASGVLANKTLKEGVQKEMGSSAIVLLQTYSKSPNPANSAVCDFAKFEAQMDTNPGLVALLQKAKAFLGQTIADGTNTYNEGLKELNAGKAQYAQGLADYEAAPAKLAAGEKQVAAGEAELAQGYADYAAAPAKLADGERQVADGEAQLAQGYADYAAAPAKLADAEKQLADGRKQLADGKKKLAEYEDGEQQVRDGLATLMATKADPGLESILDRRNGDDNFDDANGHLQLEKGLEAVDTGRGYQADSGELITKEVTNRAVGTAAGLGAAALAVLAAVLSFLKKNKGAAVSAVLAAVAGGIGAGVGFSAGEYYSDIAGSTIGNTPFIAALVLAIVAAVFAVVHFTTKPEAK